MTVGPSAGWWTWTVLCEERDRAKEQPGLRCRRREIGRNSYDGPIEGTSEFAFLSGHYQFGSTPASLAVKRMCNRLPPQARPVPMPNALLLAFPLPEGLQRPLRIMVGAPLPGSGQPARHLTQCLLVLRPHP